MIQRSDGSDLTLEAIAEALSRNLDRHLAAHARVVRAVNLAHAARA
jgi:hypothetical protein